MTCAASFLAYLGAAPLLAAALLMIADPLNGAAAQAFLVVYGATLLIFFGGVRWGVAVMKPAGPTPRALLGAALPMLYKQYADLCEPDGVRFLAFGIDPAFGHCVDGLVRLDLTRIKASKRGRYLAERGD